MRKCARQGHHLQLSGGDTWEAPGMQAAGKPLSCPSQEDGQSQKLHSESSVTGLKTIK